MCWTFSGPRKSSDHLERTIPHLKIDVVSLIIVTVNKTVMEPCPLSTLKIILNLAYTLYCLIFSYIMKKLLVQPG